MATRALDVKKLAGLQYQHAWGTQALGLELETVPRAHINLPLGENTEVQVSEEGRLWSCLMICFTVWL